MEPAVTALLLHEGELGDVLVLLDELGVETHESAGAGASGLAPGLVVGTPSRLLGWRPLSDPAPVRIAVCDGGSRTLDDRLQAAGVDYVLRRPVHPAALRLLLLHALYRGPERRRLRRVSAGVPVQVRVGWRRWRVLLLEFSTAGCRMLCPRAVAPDARVTVHLPEELGLGRSLAVKGRVVRSGPALDGAPGDQVVAVDFGDLSMDVRQRLAAAVVARARMAGARLDGPAPAERATSADEAPGAGVADPGPGGGERRHSPRGRYDRPVAARSPRDTLVLVGTNLSAEGMHVAADPRLAVGDRVQLELYGHGDIPPLRLDAEVARDDGEHGLYLAFRDLWPGAPAVLDRLIRTLPLLTPGGAAGGGRSTVISEVLETASPRR